MVTVWVLSKLRAQPAVEHGPWGKIPSEQNERPRGPWLIPWKFRNREQTLSLLYGPVGLNTLDARAGRQLESRPDPNRTRKQQAAASTRGQASLKNGSSRRWALPGWKKETKQKKRREPLELRLYSRMIAELTGVWLGGGQHCASGASAPLPLAAALPRRVCATRRRPFPRGRCHCGCWGWAEVGVV